MRLTKIAAKAILNSQIKKYTIHVTEVREYKGKALVKYTCNGGKCCTFLSIKLFHSWEYARRVEASKYCRVMDSLGNGTYAVEGSQGDVYTVNPGAKHDREKCTCKDCFYREVYCKHQIALDNYFANQSLAAFVL